MIDGTPLLRLYAAHRLRRLDRQVPAATQARQLARLVAKAADTPFGREHGFARIRTVRDFQERVPLRRYEDFWEGWWRAAFPNLSGTTWPGAVPYLAATSGTTTGLTKYIPVSTEMLAANRRAAFDLLAFHVRNRPATRVLGGLNFMLGGTTALVREAPGVHSGDLSGIAAREVPAWARPYYFPPPDLALMTDWDEKVDAMGRRSLAEDIRMVGGTASWLLLFFERMRALAPDRGEGLAGLYPNLELVVHGGVDFTPYRAAFERLLAGSRAELREVYPASEGFLAAADRGTGEGLRLLLDNGLFFEFVPVEELGAAAPTRHWVADAEEGVNYAVVLSSCAGVWSYVLGDTVRFVSRRPPRVLISGRTSYSLSAFGEHLIGEEVERAVTGAAAAIGATVRDYAVGAVHSSAEGRLGGHLYVVEFAGGPPDAAGLAAFGGALDRLLRGMNADYRDHRGEGFGIDPPQVLAAPPGAFAAWMRRRGKLGGQHKVPRIINDPGMLEDLRAFAAKA